MKEIHKGNKIFKIIPEANRVEGCLFGKWVNSDLKEGIKPINKLIIKHLSDILTMMSISDDNPFACNESDEMFPVISGKAFCDSEDVFDDKTGMDVCAAKMELKNHVKLAGFYSRMHKLLVETAIIVDAWCIKHHEKAKAIEDDLINYYGRGKN